MHRLRRARSPTVIVARLISLAISASSVSSSIPDSSILPQAIPRHQQPQIDTLFIHPQTFIFINKMRASTFLAAALALVPAALAVDQSKSAIIWFEDPATPDYVVAQAKEKIIKAGGEITHEYTIIKYVQPLGPVCQTAHELTFSSQGLLGERARHRA
jgi:hypothetical protein